MSGTTSGSRREFLKTVGLATGAWALSGPLRAPSGPLGGASALPPMAHPQTIGVLLPELALHHTSSADLLAGLRLYLRMAGGAPVRVVSRAQSQPGAATSACRDLLDAEGADIVLGAVGAPIAAQLAPICEERGRVFLQVDAGANVVRRDEASAPVLASTLGYWQANRALGAWAAQGLGRRAFLAPSLHESGFDAFYAFRCGFEGAGGEVVGLHVTNIPGAARDLPRMIAAVRSARPDVVYASQSGSQAVDLLRAWGASGLAIPLVGSAFLTDEALLPQVGSAALGIRTCLGWAPTVATEENRAFVAAFHDATGHAPTPFAVLGYDTAHLIATASGAVRRHLSASEALRPALAAAAVSGPRGVTSLDGGSETSGSPLYLREVQARGGALVNQALDVLRPAAADARIAALRLEQRSGWTQPHLGIA